MYVLSDAPIPSEVLPPSVGHGVCPSPDTWFSLRRQGVRPWGPATTEIDFQLILPCLAPPSTPAPFQKYLTPLISEPFLGSTTQM